MKRKREWFFAFCAVAGMLLVNPLYAWAGMSPPLRGVHQGSEVAKIAQFLTSSYGIQYVLDGVLSMALGKLRPHWVYVIEHNRQDHDDA